MEPINEFFSLLSSFLWGWPMIILLLGTHVFLTFRLRVPQRKLLTGIRLSVKKDSKAEGDVSQFGALATALAATIGTGNIVGVATAVALGGPGAVLWCWLTGIFGMSTKYAEGLLAVKYRVKSDDGRMYGGPMYALERGLNMKWLGTLFAVFTALASFGIGCTVQANSIALLAHETFGIPTWIVGIFVCLLAASVILGGVKAIAKVCTYLANNRINILDISQTIVQDYFNMMMIVDMNDSSKPFGDVSDELAQIGEEIGVVVRCQREDIFKSMHRV